MLGMAKLARMAMTATTTMISIKENPRFDRMRVISLPGRSLLFIFY
jgi:hypothetical protein